MKIKFEQRWSTIQPISTKQTITSHLKSFLYVLDIIFTSQLNIIEKKSVQVNAIVCIAIG
jgi:hypothetical protein